MPSGDEASGIETRLRSGDEASGTETRLRSGDEASGVKKKTRRLHAEGRRGIGAEGVGCAV